MSSSDSDSYSKLAMAKTALSAVGSIAASVMVAHTVLCTYLPQEIQDYIFLGSRSLFHRFTNQLTMIIYEHEGLFNNEIYDAVQLYLTTKISDDMLRLKVSKLEMEKNIVTNVEKNQEITDYYNGVKVKWIWVFEKSNSTTDTYNSNNNNSVSTSTSDIRSFQLSFHKKHKHNIVGSYLPFILEEAKTRKNKNKTVKIHTIDTEDMYRSDWAWTSVNMDHPASFETVAMESNMKEMVMKDLDMFVSRRDYYRKVGKAWKRGYLLYGPPGTGKSSLIAAMANYLNFDIYDLELTDIERNSQLRQVLVKTANKSILVVEDIDCTIELQERSNSSSTEEDEIRDLRKSRVTLSGFLNFIDGLWSSCGDERIIIFTTNHKEKLDPALLRPGRMDLHIHMSYCTPCGFKQLAFNYLGIKDHRLFSEIEDLIAKTEVTPAEVAEQLSKNNDPDVTLVGLIDFLHIKTKENEEAKIKNIQLDKENEEAKIKKMQEKENKKNGKIEQDKTSELEE